MNNVSGSQYSTASSQKFKITNWCVMNMTFQTHQHFRTMSSHSCHHQLRHLHSTNVLISNNINSSRTYHRYKLPPKPELSEDKLSLSESSTSLRSVQKIKKGKYLLLKISMTKFKFKNRYHFYCKYNFRYQLWLINYYVT